MDRATSAAGEEKLGGVRVHVKLKVGGDDFEISVYEILGKNGVAGFVVEVAAPAHTWMYPWHRAVGSGGTVFLAILVIKDEVEGWDGGVVADLGHRSGVVRWECGEAWFRAEVFFQPLELLLG
jgi:hypothetical protein